MVPIEDKINYLNRISENLKLSAFNHLLIGKAISMPFDSDLSEADEIYFGIISAIQSNDKTSFEKQFNKKSKSNPSKESPAPFVNDDFLVFSVIVGVSKFNIDNSWIKYIVSIRSKNPITTTLDNLLAENYYSTNNLPEIVFMFLQNINSTLITNDFLNYTFKRINENTALLGSKSDFQILCAIHAYNSIILLKEAPEGSEIQLLKSFDSRFVKRMKVLSWMFQMGILIGLIYGLLKLPIYSPETVVIINNYNWAFTILGALGFTFFGNQWSFIRRKTHELTMKLFGYPYGLIRKEKHAK
ncbi:MAG: hypothetical protein IPL74_17695 [Bacteroidetes bacterium]|nr:hypothetical protein [Bacteroidota bacterium]